MKKIFFTLSVLISTIGFSQETLSPKLIDIGKKGDSKMSSLKVVEDDLFFTGYNLHHRNFAKYNFASNTFSTYNNLPNELSEYVETNYVVIDDNIFFVSGKTIKKSNSKKNFEEFFIGVDRIVEFKQINKKQFIFINQYYDPPTNRIYFDIYISDGSKTGTILLNKRFETYDYQIKGIKEDQVIYSINSESFVLDTKTNQSKSIPYSAKYSDLFYINNTMYGFISPTTGIEFEFYSFDEVLKATLIGNFTYSTNNRFKVDWINGEGNKYYFVADNHLFSLNTSTNQIKDLKHQVSSVEELSNFFVYNGDDYFTQTINYHSKNYRIKNNVIEEYKYDKHESFSYPIVFDNKLFYNYEGIWAYDFKTNTTEQVETNESNLYFAKFTYPFIYKDELYFQGSDQFNGEELYKISKGNYNKQLVKNYNTSQGSSPYQFHKINNEILFFGNENYLYKINPRTLAFDFLKTKEDNLITSSGSYMIHQLDDKKMIFTTKDFELAFTDGTKSGTSIFEKKNSHENALIYFTENAVVLNGKLIFVGENKYKGKEPWVTNGTKEGTFILQDIVDGYEGASPIINKNGILGNKLFFTAKKESYHQMSSGLFVTEGTVETTKQINFRTDAQAELKIFGNFKNQLILSIKDQENYYTPKLVLLNPDTLKTTDLEISYSPTTFFEFENKLYLSEFNNLYYYDENHKLINVIAEQSIDLVPLKNISGTYYLYSKSNHKIYSLKNNQLNIITDYLFNSSHNFVPKVADNYIYFAFDHYEEDSNEATNRVGVISSAGLKYYDFEFENEENSDHFSQNIQDYKIIDNKLYFSKYNYFFGDELYIVDIDIKTLSTLNQNQPIKVNSYFNVYPNPVKDYLNIISKNENEILEVEIYNTIGQKIRTERVKSNQKINLTSLAKGIYFVKISNGLNVESKKVIIN